MKIKNTLKRLSALVLGLGLTFGVLGGVSLEKANEANAFTETTNSITIKPSDISLPLSYGDSGNLKTTSTKFADLIFSRSGVMKKDNKNDIFQFRKSTAGHLWNTSTPSGLKISSISLQNATDSGFNVYAGDTVDPTNLVSLSNGSYEIDNIYFSIVSTKTAYFDSITIVFENQTQHSHDNPLAHTDAVPSNCNKTGTKEYYYCSGCKKYFEDKNAQNEIGDATALNIWLTEGNGFIPQREHDLEYVEDDKNQHIVSCKYEDCEYIETEDHNWGTPEIVGSNMVYTCDKCGATKDEPYEYKVASITATSSKEEYVLGEDLELTVTATMTDNTQVPLTSSDYTVTGYDKYTVGNQNLTIALVDDNSVDCNLNISVVAKQLQTIVSYDMVTDASDLKVGDVIVIAAKDYDYAISTTQNSNNRDQSEITKSGNTLINVSNTVQRFTLTEGEKGFGLYTGSGYLYAAASGSNYMKTQETNNVNGEWTITINDSTASIVATESSYRNVMQYNNSSSIFSCYASASQKPLCIYKETKTTQGTSNLIKLTALFSHSGNTLYAGDSVTAEDFEIKALYDTSGEYVDYTNFEIKKLVGGEPTSSCVLSEGNNTFRIVAKDNDNIYVDVQVNDIETKTAVVTSIELSGEPTTKDYYYNKEQLSWDFTGLKVVVHYDTVSDEEYLLSDLVAANSATIDPAYPTVPQKGNAVSFNVKFSYGGKDLDTDVTGLTCQNLAIASISWTNRFANVEKKVFAGTKINKSTFGNVSAAYNNKQSVENFSIADCTIAYYKNAVKQGVLTFDSNNDITITSTMDGCDIRLEKDNVVSAYNSSSLFEVVDTIQSVNKVISGGATYNGSITFSSCGYSNEDSLTSFNINSVEDGTKKIEVTAEGGKYYNTGAALRIYGGKKLTLKSSSELPIVSVTLTFGTGDGTNAITANVGTYSNNKWTGSASSLTFTVGGSSGHRRIASISVVFGSTGDSNIDLANKDFDTQKEALEFAQTLTNATLDEDWSNLSTTFAALSGDAKDLLLWATANENGDNLQKAVAKYDAYTAANNITGTDNFIGRTVKHNATLVPEVAPTCTSDGTVAHYHCDLCNKNFEDEECTKLLNSVVDPAKGHTLNHVSAKDCTCEETGNVEYWHCTECQKNFSDANGTNEITNITVPAKGHSAKHVDAVQATCTTAGNVEYWHCDDCNKNFADEQYTIVLNSVVVPAKGHNLNKVEANAPTCTTDGNVEYWHCDDCNKNFSDANGTNEINNVIVPMTGHDWQFVEATEPVDEDHPGYAAHYECACGEIVDTNYQPTTLNDLKIEYVKPADPCYVDALDNIADNIQGSTAEIVTKGSTAVIKNVEIDEFGNTLVSAEETTGVLLTIDATNGKTITEIEISLDCEFTIWIKFKGSDQYVEWRTIAAPTKSSPKRAMLNGDNYDLPDNVESLEIVTDKSPEQKVQLKALNYRSEVNINLDLGFSYVGSGPDARIDRGQLHFNVDGNYTGKYGFLLTTNTDLTINEFTSDELAELNVGTDVRKYEGRTSLCIGTTDLTKEVKVVFYSIDAEGNVEYGKVVVTSFEEIAKTYEYNPELAKGDDAFWVFTNYQTAVINGYEY